MNEKLKKILSFVNWKLGFRVILVMLLGVYVLVTSLESVKPHTVVIIRELRVNGSGLALKSRALVNEGDKSKTFLKQPKIPFTGIGYHESTTDMEVKDINVKFAFYTTDDKTGNKEDREHVQAFIVEGKVNVNDWEKLVSRLDLSQFNYAADNDPYAKRYYDRIEIMAEQLKAIARSGEPEGRLMSLEQSIQYWQNELVSRRNFVVALKDKFGFTTEEEIWNFIKNEAPWYYILGINRFEALANNAKELSEYVQSIHLGGLSLRGSSERHISNEDILMLINYVRRAYQYELALNEIADSLAQVEVKKERMKSPLDEADRILAEALCETYKSNLEIEGVKFTDLSSDYLDRSFDSFLNGLVINLVKALRFERLLEIRKNFHGGFSDVIGIELSKEEEDIALSILEDLKITLKDEFESEDWEKQAERFNLFFTQYVKEHPGYGINNSISLFINFNLSEYYLNHLYEKMKGYKYIVDSDKALTLMYPGLANVPSTVKLDSETLRGLLYSYFSTPRFQKIFQTTYWLLGVNIEGNTALKNKASWEAEKEGELVPFFEHQKIDADMEENEALWEAAIKDGLNGEDFSVLHPYLIHDVGPGETLELIAEKYGIDLLWIFKENKYSLKFSDPEDQAIYASLYEENESYNFSKNRVLETGNLIAVPKYEKFSDEWWEATEEFREKREIVMKQYVYPWIEEYAPKAFDVFINETPYLDHLERTYGIEFEDITLSILKMSLYSNLTLKEVDQDFYELYQYKESLKN